MIFVKSEHALRRALTVIECVFVCGAVAFLAPELCAGLSENVEKGKILTFDDLW